MWRVSDGAAVQRTRMACWPSTSSVGSGTPSAPGSVVRSSPVVQPSTTSEASSARRIPPASKRIVSTELHGVAGPDALLQRRLGVALDDGVVPDLDGWIGQIAA